MLLTNRTILVALVVFSTFSTLYANMNTPTNYSSWQVVFMLTFSGGNTNSVCWYLMLKFVINIAYTKHHY